MRTYRLLVLAGWLTMTAGTALGGEIDCCVCASCPGVQCFEVPGASECSPAACIQNGCPSGQSSIVFDLCNSVPACTAQPGPAAAPALSPMAGGAALLALVALARRALKR